MTFLFPILLLAMGVYVLIGAIKGEGRLFSMENFKEDCLEKAKKSLRVLYFALAVIMFLMAIVNGAQSVLYSNKLTYFRITDAYKDNFSDLFENGQLTYTAQESVGGTSCYGGGGSTVEKVYGPYSPDNQMMEAEEIRAFIYKAYDAYKEDQTKFPTVSGGLLSCGGTSVDYAKYYQQTDLIDDSGNALYATTDAEKAQGHVVYVSSIGNVRSDTSDGSFLSKLYGFLSPTLLSVLNYVFLGLAVVCLALLFFLTRKFTDKEKLRKAREQQVAGSRMPSGAFNFEDEPSDAQKK